MIVNRATPPTTYFSSGGSYILRCGQSGWFRRDVSAVWDYLRCAVGDPISLTLLAEPRSSPTSVAHFERIEDEIVGESILVLHTSGTTGAPKEVRKALARNLVPRSRSGENQRWLLTYAPYRWAGISVMLHALTLDAQLIAPISLDTSHLFAAARTDQATHVSLTPSLLRKLVLTVGKDDLATVDFAQVTFGGESASQSVLDLAHSIWPNARLSHVYATTEFGDVCSVSDGIAGIPRHKLEKPGFEFLVDGELVIGGQPTGDLWILKDDRYFFLSRREEMINVGGAKVSPLDVELAALGLHGVVEARAYAIPSPLIGQVVGLDYCGTADAADVRRHLREQLPKVAWPMALNRVDRIELTAAGKLSRSAPDV